MPIAQKAHLSSPSSESQISAVRCRAFGVVINTEAAGETLSLYDAATDVGATSSSRFARIKLDSAGSFAFRGAECESGLRAELSGGTPDITVVWG